MIGALAGAAAALLHADPEEERRAMAGTTPKNKNTPKDQAPFFRTRGVILNPADVVSWPWPEKARQAGLTTIGMHVTPAQIAAFVQTRQGQDFLEACARERIEVEHELHAIADLLPRSLFDKDPALFRMDDEGRRTPSANLCVSSEAAVNLVCENAVNYAKILRPTTGRYFYWIDDGKPMCRCTKCRALADSDQALLLENRILEALRNEDPRATLAHLCYANTLKPPTQIKPSNGIFLEFAPIQRQYDKPLSNRAVPVHAKMLDALDANLEVFGSKNAQALEYWLDVSRFARWKRDNVTQIPWNREVFLDDLAAYAKRGIRHITSFACWIGGEYAAQFGEPPLNEYGKGLSALSPCDK